MENLKLQIKKNLHILVIILLAYIGIKLIDNYSIVADAYKFVMGILSPFILGAVIAYALNPLMVYIEKKLKVSRGISVLLTCVIVILIFTLSIVYLVPGITGNIKNLINSIPYMVSSANEWIGDNVNSKFVLELTKKFDLAKTLGAWSTTLFNALLSSLVSVTASIIKWGFALIIAIYYLIYKEIFVKSLKKGIFIIFKNKYGVKILELLHCTNDMLGTYLGVRALESLIVAIACFIGLIFIKSQYIILISVFFGVTNMIPIFGPFLGIVFGTILNIFHSPITALVVFIWLFILQQIDGNWLGPKMSGDSVGINPVTCILSLSVGGAVYGMVGMLIAVPIAGVMKIYYERFMKRYDDRHPEIAHMVDNTKIDISHLKFEKKKTSQK
ncbi:MULTISPECIES: AI-2E family transporter [unclassified Clostridium]|uniref:AI-2E family transporter n=1 Tax=unclassified Clostridium TaxID=2614128 RepID=UPI0025BE875D|nr:MULTISPECIES: AI-2E family transporter [unclassified Clostridium]